MRIFKLKLGKNEKDMRVCDCINKVDVNEKALCSLCMDYVDYRKKDTQGLFNTYKPRSTRREFFERIRTTLYQVIFSHLIHPPLILFYIK